MDAKLDELNRKFDRLMVMIVGFAKKMEIQYDELTITGHYVDELKLQVAENEMRIKKIESPKKKSS